MYNLDQFQRLRRQGMRLYETPFSMMLTSDQTIGVHSHPLTCVFLCLRILPQTPYVKPNTKIRMYDAENVFTLLKSLSQKLTFGYLFEIRKQTPLK